MDYADSAVEAELHRATGDLQRILSIADRTAQHGVDIDIKFCMHPKPLKFLIQHLQALFRDFIGIDVVDADLQVVETGAVQPPDAFNTQEISIRQQTCKHSTLADAMDHRIHFGM